MVPSSNSRTSGASSLPRASGDGPRYLARWCWRTPSPPRERGWSPYAWPWDLKWWVSPARAGMVPARRRVWLYRRRLPRASGDGPRTKLRKYTMPRSPPRERGWSRPAGSPARRSRVSPARAGMVPGPGLTRIRRLSLPRASGDGPWTGLDADTPLESPPRERGWSLDGILELGHGSVSPARAGMVPSSVQPSSFMRGLPRASGDGPCTTSCFFASKASPPRERGWSRGRFRPVLVRAVSPARAGMVRCRG